MIYARLIRSPVFKHSTVNLPGNTLKLLTPPPPLAPGTSETESLLQGRIDTASDLGISGCCGVHDKHGAENGYGHILRLHVKVSRSLLRGIDNHASADETDLEAVRCTFNA